jgi:hypothetical protein
MEVLKTITVAYTHMTRGGVGSFTGGQDTGDPLTALSSTARRQPVDGLYPNPLAPLGAHTEDV